MLKLPSWWRTGTDGTWSKIGTVIVFILTFLAVAVPIALATLFTY